MRFLEKDVRIEHIGASSKGGQKANRKRNNVRLTHLPTGIRVIMAGRSSLEQKMRNGLRELRRRVAAHFDVIARQKQQAEAKDRRRLSTGRKTAFHAEQKKRLQQKKSLRRKKFSAE